jgi:hypothetical protein
VRQAISALPVGAHRTQRQNGQVDGSSPSLVTWAVRSMRSWNLTAQPRLPKPLIGESVHPQGGAHFRQAIVWGTVAVQSGSDVRAHASATARLVAHCSQASCRRTRTHPRESGRRSATPLCSQQAVLHRCAFAKTLHSTKAFVVFSLYRPLQVSCRGPDHATAKARSAWGAVSAHDRNKQAVLHSCARNKQCYTAVLLPKHYTTRILPKHYTTQK